ARARRSSTCPTWASRRRSSTGSRACPARARSSTRRGRWSRAVRLVAIAAPPWVREPADLPRLGPAYADLVELRLDLLPHRLDVAAAVAASPRPCLATVRSRGEDGAFSGAPREASRILLASLSAGAAWIDAEAAVLPLVAEAAARAGVPVLLSSHGDGPV